MVNVKNLPNAYKEVFVILNNMEKESIDKIPDNFKQMIKEKMNNEYQFEINDEGNWENLELLQETKTILAYIFLNYWATENQRKVVQDKFRKEFIEKEKNKAKNYGEKEILRKFELLRTEELREEEKLEILLDLAILNGDKETYINRYNVNSKLIKEESEISEQLKGSKLIKPFSIGRKVFTGENPVIAEDYKKMTEIIKIEFLTNEKNTKGDD